MDLEEGRTGIRGRAWLPSIQLRVQKERCEVFPSDQWVSPPYGVLLTHSDYPEVANTGVCFTPEGSNQEADLLPGHLST